MRPEDVSAQNQVLSTAMTDLELEVTGKGIVNDSTYRQNPLVRLLEKLLVFLEAGTEGTRDEGTRDQGSGE